jgi:hypothetical protein
MLQMTCSKDKQGDPAGGAVDGAYVLPMAIVSNTVVKLVAERLLPLSAAQIRVLQLDLEQEGIARGGLQLQRLASALAQRASATLAAAWTRLACVPM